MRPGPFGYAAQAHQWRGLLFLNRSRTHIKLLHWERGGFVLYYKRLEQGTFWAPGTLTGELGWSDLVLMVEGVRVVKSIQKKRFSIA